MDPATAPMARVDGSSPSDSATPVTAETRLRALIEQDELSNQQMRLRRAVWVGVAGWSAFILNDLYGFFLTPADIVHAEMLAVRPATALIGVVFAILLGREGWSRRAQRAAEIGLFGIAGVGVGLIALLATEDLLSVHIVGVILVVLVHAVTIGSDWRRAMLPIVLAAFAPAAVFAAAAPLFPQVAAQWVDAAVIVRFVQNYAIIAAAVALTLVGGQVVADLRRQVSEARSIGRYRLRKRIAAGGMGEVWVAYHTALARDVAVKLMRVHAADARAVERFEREVRATAELTHPNVVRVFDYGVTADGVWYYAMELLAGSTLGALVRAEGALEPERALRLITQAAQALAEAHRRGIVHRDVKPANLMVVRSAGEEYVKLIDFGIARVVEEASDLTRTGMVVGTPGYIAPEVLAGAPATTRSDVYALGMVLYFALAGRVPFDAESPESAVRRTAQEPQLPPLESVPGDLAAVIARCLAREPADRYASGEELAHALRDCTLS